MVLKVNISKIGKIIGIIASFSLLSCSSGGSGGSSGQAAFSALDDLIITAPKDIKTGVVPDYGYVVITNPTDKVIQNINYKLSDQTNGGQQITLNSLSTSNCSSIPAHHNCIIQLNANNATTSGSFRLVLKNQEKTISKIKTPVIGVEPVQYSNLSTVDGVILSYYHTVLAGTPFLLVNAVVTANNIGKYNSIVLTDGHNNPIPNQQIISANAGAGFSNLFQGSNVSILLPLPTGEISQVIKARVEKVDAKGQVSDYANIGSMGTLVTVKNSGIANMIPSIFYLTSQNPSQTVTFTNNGDKSVELKSLLPNNPNLTVNFSSTSITRGEVATATISLKHTVSNIVSSNIDLVSSSGDSTTIVYQAPESTIVDTSSKKNSIASNESSVAGLALAFNSDNNFYSTTATGVVTRQLIITNTGNTVENNIQFNLPTGFTFANGASNSCSLAGSNQISNFLNSNESCSLTVIYTNSNLTPLSNASVTANYSYDSGIKATPVVSTVNYQVSQATANLVASPSSYNFGSVYVEGNESSSKVFTIQNIGEITADYITFGNQPPFKTVSSTCSSLAPGMSCQANVELNNAGFSGIGTYSSPLVVSYSNTASQNNQTSQNLSTLSGIVYASVYLASDETTGIGFAGGNGSSQTPYIAESGSNATLTYYYRSSHSTADLQSFYVAISELPAGWVRSGGTCAASAATATALGRYAYCTVTFTFNGVLAGNYNFNQNVMTAHWVDSASNKQLSQTASSDMVYTSLSKPIITILYAVNYSTQPPVMYLQTNPNSVKGVLALSGAYQGYSPIQVSLIDNQIATGAPYPIFNMTNAENESINYLTLTVENPKVYFTVIPTQEYLETVCPNYFEGGATFGTTPRGIPFLNNINVINLYISC